MMESKSKGYFLAKYDISGIQRYIFATNRLKENVGASYQVTKILEEYLPEAVREAVFPQYTSVIDWKEEENLSITENQSIMAEIIYIGGGNAMVLFRDIDTFQKVSQFLAERVAQNCQGLYLAAAYIDTDLKSFQNDVKRLDKRLSENKADMIRQPIYSPFPVVEQDNSTHQPITHRYVHKDEERDGDTVIPPVIEDMTKMQYQKWMAYQEVRSKRIGKLYPDIEAAVDYDYPVDMDDLCREPGGNSYIAVVHIDGNGMGKQIQDILHEQDEYEKAVPLLRENSKEISAVFQKTYKNMLKVLCSHSELLRSSKDGTILPMRPIVLDGDDFTFLCTADLAIPLATGFLKELIKGQEGKQKKISACAGIAFVHSHFPFYEAYCIAEDSCSDAKKKWYKGKENGNQEDCFLDFRILKGSEVGGTKRHEEWQVRPYAIDLTGKQPDSLVHLYEIVKKMEGWPSNRLHKIYRTMLKGDEQMEVLEREFSSRGYDIEELTQVKYWEKSPLYDALEVRGLCEMKLLADFLEIQEKQSDEKMDSED